jgi:hypothetical protein
MENGEKGHREPLERSSDSNTRDVLAAGEEVLDRVRAVSRDIADRVRQLMGLAPRRDES